MDRHKALFPPWFDRLVRLLLAVGAAGAVFTLGLVLYAMSPVTTSVGYQPVQPVPYSHRLHAGELQIDCRYCHASVEVSAVANVPPTQTCMNCHRTVARTSELLQKVRDSAASGRPMRWVRVHKLPEYAYFDHHAHVRAGIGCVSCHGHVEEMDVVRQAQPLSMGWCLECHRDPQPQRRPLSEITNMAWKPARDAAESGSDR